ncbi:MAG TPA: hypothetical protein PLF32_01045 [Bacteroidales bacterium]|nr:hypothetical protein [Bacteroidales bacterium]HOR81225.1 hypothetical protein [Bacteroidales bacterium]HPJ90492.1 hypothetical protein [Bacteroidales bacterium]
MKTRHLFFFIIIIFIFIGCKQHCLDFPTPIVEMYFPYSEGKILTFCNTQNDTLTTTITTISYYGDNSNTAYKRNCDCVCGSGYKFISNGDIEIKGNIESSSLPENSFFSFIHLDIELHLSPNENYLASIWNENVENMLTTKNYAVFGDTAFLENPQSSFNVTIIKNKGITEWMDGNGEIWKLIH